MPKILASSTYRNNGALLITWDEGENATRTSAQIAEHLRQIRGEAGRRRAIDHHLECLVLGGIWVSRPSAMNVRSTWAFCRSRSSGSSASSPNSSVSLRASPTK